MGSLTVMCPSNLAGGVAMLILNNEAEIQWDSRDRLVNDSVLLQLGQVGSVAPAPGFLSSPYYIFDEAPSTHCSLAATG